VKRRASGAPGGIGSVGGRPVSVLLGVLVLVLAACGQATSTNQPAAPTEPPVTAPVETPPPTEPPTTEPGSEAPTEPPPVTAEPATPEPAATPEPEPTSGAGVVSSCSGSDENRDFFASMAAAVNWTVYCPVLGDGWFVDDGRYRLAGGGWLEIGYDGPGDARLILRQGAFCSSSDGCVPPGAATGTTDFGDRNGTLIADDDGTWSVVVDRGANPSWLLVADGLGQAAVRTIASNLQPVPG
jgi:hypothetical protein